MRYLISSAALGAFLLLAPTAMAAPKDGFFDSAGVRIHFLEEGTGPTVVLVHGFTSSADTWIRNGVFQALSTRYHVIALDCRGHGQSDKPHDIARYGPEMGRDVLRLLDMTGIPRAHLVGYSMGAQIALQLVTVAPERFLSVVLGGATGRWRWSTDDQRLADTEAAELEQRMLRSLLVRTAASGQQPTEAQIRGESERRLAGLDTTALAAVRRSMHDTVVTPTQIKSITIPVLGIVGTEDPALTDFRELKTLLPTMELVLIDGASHVSAPTRPEFLNAVLHFWGE